MDDEKNTGQENSEEQKEIAYPISMIQCDVFHFMTHSFHGNR